MTFIFILYFLSILNVKHVISFVGAENASIGDAISISKLKHMEFHQGQDTTYKRSSPIPQLRCIKGCEYEVGMPSDITS